MTGLRRIWAVVFLTFAFAFGQQGVLQHSLGHAIQRVQTTPQDQFPVFDTCEKCPAFASLASAVSSHAFLFDAPAAPQAIALFTSTPAASRTVVHSLSRAPPLSL